MKIKAMFKWAVLPVMTFISWMVFQSFEGRGPTITIQYDLTTTAFDSPVTKADALKLSTTGKLNAMVYKSQTRNVGTFDAHGEFNIQITPLTPPTLGGQPVPLDDMSTITINRNGVFGSNGDQFPLEPGALEDISSFATTLASYSSNCAYRAGQIAAIANQLISQGAAQSLTSNGYTTYRIGDKETVLDLPNNLYIADIERANGNLISEIYYEYDSRSRDGVESADGSCGILKRITTRKLDNSGAAQVVKVVVRDISNLIVTNR